MRNSLHTIVETPEFIGGVRHVLTDRERRDLINFLAANPAAGDLMQGTGGARKLRWGTGSKGKRGGSRVISYYAGPDIPVFLLSIFAKGDRANLSKAERNELRQVLSDLADEYRKGTR